MNNKIAKQLEFKTKGNKKKYKVEGICDNAVYAKKLEAGYLSGLYYLVSRESNLEDENTWKHILVVQHLRKLVNTFYKDHFNKPTIISLPINSALPIVKHTTLPNLNDKQMCNQPVSNIYKKAKH